MGLLRSLGSAIAAPFRWLAAVLTALLVLLGKTLAVLLGLAFVGVGTFLTMTIGLAPIGVPVGIFGFLILWRALMR